MKQLLAACALVLATAPALAQNTPVGLWKSIDDDTKKEKSLVRIVEADGVLVGRIEKLLDPDRKPDAVCEKCDDDRKDKPVLGLNIIRGVQKTPTDAGAWEGGTILDPAKGKVYRLRLQMADEGRKLEVRGYIGTPMLGRSQTWIRVE
jgi:uncharacterized protein (DUF2147 family)